MKNISNQISVEASNIIAVVNDKGGVGKSVLSKYVLATLAKEKYKTVNIYEIDNNNKKGNFNSSLINHHLFKINDKNEAIFDVSFYEDDAEVCSIIDCGGGDDVKSVIEALSKNKIENVSFFIPTLDDDETVDNIKSTLDEIRTYYPDSKVTLVLNKAQSNSLEEAKIQFINIFGSEKYGYKSEYEQLAKSLNSIAIVPHTNLIFLMKNHHRLAMTDLYFSSVNLINNLKENRAIWKKEALEKNDKDYYHKKMDLVDFGTDLIDYIEQVKKTLKV